MYRRGPIDCEGGARPRRAVLKSTGCVRCLVPSELSTVSTVIWNAYLDTKENQEARARARRAHGRVRAIERGAPTNKHVTRELSTDAAPLPLVPGFPVHCAGNRFLFFRLGVQPTVAELVTQRGGVGAFDGG